MIARVFALLFACLLLAPAALAERQWIAGGAVPSRYEISINPRIADGAFDGEVRIAVTAGEPLSAVTLNAAALEIERATINGRRAAFTLNEATQTLTLTPARPLPAGAHTIVIRYRGKINDEAYGLFRAVYEADGEEKVALATQFEPGDARRFAPMWDQPNLRAVFSLTVTAPADLFAVSNMPVAERTELSRGRARIRFADTPSMPSYLLFFGLGDFERVTQDVDGVELGVVVRRGAGARAGEALRAGAETLRYFTGYFGIPYPLPKLDMIAVPGAGSFGAMENWGAILYFDQYLLHDPQIASELDRRGVFAIVAHEIAHQWFGNLVTMTWWDDLWLNEGFASWMAAKAMDALHPEWSPWLVQLAEGTSTAMAIDARAGTHPVVQEINTIDEANLAFDTITYEKGLAVVRMLEAYVGEEDFRAGVRAYLGERLYGNARTEDLWRAVQAASGEPVLDIARGFTTQPGFPLITAAAGPCRRGASGPIRLTQRRFALDAASRTEERWTIPILAGRVGAPAQRFVAPAQAETAIDLGAGCGPYIVNAGQSGFFRVRYDEANFVRLRDAFARLETVDQLGLLLDYWALGRAGDAPFADYLSLTAALPADAHMSVVLDTAASMRALAIFARGRASEDAIRTYGRAILRPHFDRVGWETREGEDPNDALMRAELIAALGALKDEAIVAEARRRVSEDDLPAAIREATLSVYGRAADAQAYDALRARAAAQSDFVEQRKLWLVLAGAEDAALARRTLALLDGEAIPRQLRLEVLSAVADAHPRLAWDYLAAHRALVESWLDPLQYYEFPPELAAKSTDVATADALEAYAANFPEGVRDAVIAATAAIRTNAAFIETRMPEIEAWIAAR